MQEMHQTCAGRTLPVIGEGNMEERRLAKMKVGSNRVRMGGWDFL